MRDELGHARLQEVVQSKAGHGEAAMGPVAKQSLLSDLVQREQQVCTGGELCMHSNHAQSIMQPKQLQRGAAHPDAAWLPQGGSEYAGRHEDSQS